MVCCFVNCTVDFGNCVPKSRATPLWPTLKLASTLSGVGRPLAASCRLGRMLAGEADGVLYALSVGTCAAAACTAGRLAGALPCGCAGAAVGRPSSSTGILRVCETRALREREQEPN